ncbi:HAD family phosphatase, partial [Candidatus Babeliales bacterium]|nr:HAD family phosphatase [Candidatus Babeliales bacterium]
MKAIKNIIKAVIFDMDGTIIRSEHIWLNATKQLLINYGMITFNTEQEKFLNDLSGIGLKQCVEAMKVKFNLQADIEKLVNEVKELAISSFKNHAFFIEGFPTFHEKLHKNGIKSSIATNSDQESLTRLSE